MPCCKRRKSSKQELTTHQATLIASSSSTNHEKSRKKSCCRKCCCCLPVRGCCQTTTSCCLPLPACYPTATFCCFKKRKTRSGVRNHNSELRSSVKQLRSVADHLLAGSASAGQFSTYNYIDEEEIHEKITSSSLVPTAKLAERNFATTSFDHQNRCVGVEKFPPLAQISDREFVIDSSEGGSNENSDYEYRVDQKLVKNHKNLVEVYENHEKTDKEVVDDDENLVGNQKRDVYLPGKLLKHSPKKSKHPPHLSVQLANNVWLKEQQYSWKHDKIVEDALVKSKEMVAETNKEENRRSTSLPPESILRLDSKYSPDLDATATGCAKKRYTGFEKMRRGFKQMFNAGSRDNDMENEEPPPKISSAFHSQPPQQRQPLFQDYQQRQNVNVGSNGRGFLQKIFGAGYGSEPQSPTTTPSSAAGYWGPYANPQQRHNRFETDLESEGDYAEIRAKSNERDDLARIFKKRESMFLIKGKNMHV
uniref:Uncharacterized protein n=1 Tax=Ditylenchus dipsaci TaxID=166011 RepID=A0A915D183_9BILA